MNWMPGHGMIGTYYDTLIPKTGNPNAPIVVQRPDPTIQFDWEDYSPLDTREGPSIWENTFAARWQGHIYIPSCRTIEFYTRSHDGVYLKINHAPSGGGDETLIDQWNDHGPTDHYRARYLCQGTYPLEMRHYENGGWAVIKVEWDD